jgi:hypothetical protein
MLNDQADVLEATRGHLASMSKKSYHQTYSARPTPSGVLLGFFAGVKVGQNTFEELS